MAHRLVLALLVLAATAPAQTAKKHLLAIGEVKGFQHDSVSHALATIERLGRESGLFDTYVRTDSQLITKQKLPNNAKNLDFFDAVLFYTTGELDMSAEQKKDLLAFVHDDGKGFIGVHSAIDTFYQWPEYGEMAGGYFRDHPWDIFDAPVIVEDARFPGMQAVPPVFTIRDEIYQVRNFSRANSHVIARLDAAKLDLTNPRVSAERRADKDFPIIWTKAYGKGRVYYNTLGHREETWDRKDVQTMYLEAIRWAMGSVGRAILPAAGFQPAVVK